MMDKDNKTKNKKIWHWGKSRGLKEAEKRLDDIVSDVRKLLIKHKKIKILEIGCGYGKVLLEFKRIFKNRIDTYGINLESGLNKNLIKKFALEHKIFSKDNIDENLPKIYHLDAGKKLLFRSGSFDFIFSQECFRYIKDKALFLEEVNRILKRGGIAKIDTGRRSNKKIISLKKYVLQINFKNIKKILSANYMKKTICCNLKLRTEERIEILGNGKKIDFFDYIRKFKNIQIKKARLDRYLIIHKDKNFKLNLKLIKVIDFNKIDDKYIGYKSIYSLQSNN